MHRMLRIALALGFAASTLVLASPTSAWADVELPSIFGPGMVLQHGRAVPVWGWAEPSEAVTVEFAGQRHQTKAGADGRWRITLEALAVRKRGSTLKVSGKNRITLRDVLVGEVWIASGQSNMEWPVSRSAAPTRGWKAPNPSRIRLFTVPRTAIDVPQADVNATWVSAKDEGARKRFSAVAWFFGCEICKRTRMPVGLINTSWGGTAILPWTPAAESPAPVRVGGKKVGPGAHGALYNGMIAPLIPFAIRGAIWYQGESDAARAASYAQWHPDMIEAWREAWGQGAFPFYFVQLANFKKRSDLPGESAWAELREAQRLTLSTENTGMAVIIDIGAANNIHPPNKHDVGLRLARWARAGVYGEKIVPSGPLYLRHEVQGGRVVLHFEHVGKTLKARSGKTLRGFAIAGKDGRFVWAKATIDGNTVVVTHADVPEPVAVRYAWADNPDCNLVNSEGLPASPFKTEDRPRAKPSTK